MPTLNAPVRLCRVWQWTQHQGQSGEFCILKTLKLKTIEALDESNCGLNSKLVVWYTRHNTGGTHTSLWHPPHTQNGKILAEFYKLSFLSCELVFQSKDGGQERFQRFEEARRLCSDTFLFRPLSLINQSQSTLTMSGTAELIHS